MDIEIISEDDNPMLHRTDVTFELVHEESTPSRLQVRDSLAAKLNKNADEVVIRKLDTKFGMRKTIGDAKVYETAAYARDVEQEYMLERNKIGPAEEGDGEVAEADESEADAEAEEGEADTDAEAEEGEAEADADAREEEEAETDADAEAEAEEA